MLARRIVGTVIDFNSPADLHDDLVRLRRHALSDETAVYERAVDPASAEWTTTPHPYEPYMAREFLDYTISHKQPLLSWAIDVGDRMLGTIDLTFDDATCSRGDLGFAMHPAARGRGIMPRALALVLRHAFEDLGTHTVRWRAYAGNDASWRVVEKCGFPPYEPTRTPLTQRGKAREGWQSELTREAWQARRLR